MTKTKTLRRASDTTWISDDGNFTISHMPWCSQPWVAQWTDIYGEKKVIREFTRARLMDRLKPYGDVRYALARNDWRPAYLKGRTNQ